jgi:hypothetical protein
VGPIAPGVLITSFFPKEAEVAPDMTYKSLLVRTYKRFLNDCSPTTVGFCPTIGKSKNPVPDPVHEFISWSHEKDLDHLTLFLFKEETPADLNTSVPLS